MAMAEAAAPAPGELPQTLGECHVVIDLLRSQWGQLREQVMLLPERAASAEEAACKPI